MKKLELPASGERRYLQIAKDLSERIAAGEFPPGSRLPPERELAAGLQVSRATVREALLALELMGIVEIRLGSGVFVLPGSARDIEEANALEADQAGPWDVLELRRVVEAESAYRAAQRGTDEQIEAIGRTVKQMKAAINDLARFDRVDLQFHMLIAKASGNSLIETYVGHLWQMRKSPMWDRWYQRTRDPVHRRRSAQDHFDIHRAISRRAPEIAAAAMQVHIDVLTQRFLDLNI